jgi:hypothetical protein
MKKRMMTKRLNTNKTTKKMMKKRLSDQKKYQIAKND